MLERVLKAIDTMNEWTGKGVAWLLGFLMLVVVYEVTLRYLFRSSTIWAFETSQFLFAGAAALGGGYTLLHTDHVNVEIVYSRLGTRGRAIIDLITASLFFVYMIFFLRETGVMALESFKENERTLSVWAPPMYPVNMAIFVGGVLILLQGIAKFARDWITALNSKEKVTGTGEVSERKEQ